jgi:serine/threonine protein kinase/formylglycine-generating enzyme required for sulfatase activity
MDGIDELSIEDLERIDRTCCQFEKELKQGNDGDLRGYLAGVAGRERATLLLELVALDIDYRRRRGSEIDPEEYEAMFPGDRSSILKAFVRSQPKPPPDTAESGNGATRPAPDHPARLEDSPESIGRYRILAKIASGGFGVVYRGFDEQLQRDVAIKVPHRSVISHGRHAERFLAEARLTARLNHPGIVPVYDVGRTEQGECYVVAKFMEGGDLSAKIRRTKTPPAEAAAIVAQIADALHCAHEQRLVHRDIKPSNLLMDAHGGVYLADFGAAVQESSSNVIGFVGTPAYMSPEQARGEGHRVDARTDIFALGVVLYELMTGIRPFHSQSVTQLLADIIASDPVPPRQVSAAIPAELERICLKAMSKRAADRYATAREFCWDLRSWADDRHAAESIKSALPLPVVPKGLRSFDAADAEFFLQLLPGPRDRHGLPESIRFWKARIEEKLPERTFRVGVIYGPSGSGKSSLVKAGCLPRLERRVWPVYIEANATDTEANLKQALEKVCGWEGNLPDLLRRVRKGRSTAAPKILLVIDQFEQWLHAQSDLTVTPLTSALRQCDGVNLQCLLMVRDDFWMPLVRLMAELEVPLAEGENTMAVDLFDLAHARKVLRLFGQAYEKLPAKIAEHTREQKQFLDDAVASIQHEGSVSPIRLSLFAEMMKHDAWEPATLRRVGGAEGLGVAFLERCFTRPEAPPPNRSHAQAARHVLKALLPEPGIRIRGHFRPASELMAACGYHTRPDRFADLLRLLDHKLRLVTPTDPGREAADPVHRVRVDAPPEERYYQLTHDFMVEPIREWVTQEQRQTIRGRAELCLAERASLWTAKPESRQLPGLFEWARIRLFTDSSDWTGPQRRMINSAARRSLAHLLLATVCVALTAYLGWQAAGRIRAHSALATIRTADTEDLLEVIGDTEPVRRWLTPLLQDELSKSHIDERDRRQIRLALLRDEAAQAPRIYEEAANLDPTELRVVRDGIVLYADEQTKRAIVNALWDWVQDQEAESERRFRAACLLAGLAPDSSQWKDQADDVVTWLVARPIDQVGEWLEALQPVGRHLIEPLQHVFLVTASEGGQEIAAYALARFLEDADRLERIVALIGRARPSQLPALLSTMDRRSSETVPLLEGALEDASADVQSNVLVALVSLGELDMALPYLHHSPDPTLRSLVIEKLAKARVPVQILRPWIADSSLSADVRQALILAIGNYPQSTVAQGEHASIGASLREIFMTDPDGGVHAAAEWALRRWNLAVPPLEDSRSDMHLHRTWLVTPSGQTMIVLDFPDGYVPQGATKPPQGHHFAIAAKEVVVKEFAKFRPEHRIDFRARHDDTCPANLMDWYAAAAYCNWLSEQEGLPESQWCYQPNEHGEYAEGMMIAPDFLARRGYRLPLASEWLYAASAAAQTPFFFGNDAELLSEYAWLARNSQGVHQPVGALQPNLFGFFDVYGNVKEWSHSLEVEQSEDFVVTDARQRCVLGGCFVHFQPQFQANYAKHGNPPALREYLNGFRVARTVFAPPTD